MKTRLLFLTCCFALGFTHATKAEEVIVYVTGDPIETGSGANLKGRYQNVATVDGKSVDLLGEVLSQTTGKTNDFWQGGEWAQPGDFVFSFNDMVIGETRQATVRWTFLESGTSTPVVFEEFTVTIDDLDRQLSGGAGRIETVTTSDAISYTVERMTNLTVSQSGNALSASGGMNQNSGDPEGAIRYRFLHLSSFTMTYHTEPRGAVNSAFHHDAHGKFDFDDPVDTGLGVRLYYTYHFENEEDVPVVVDFSTALPAGLVWDKEFVPVNAGSLSGGIPDYSNQTLGIRGLLLEPGEHNITFRTIRTGASGTLVTGGSIVPVSPTGPVQDATAVITLP